MYACGIGVTATCWQWVGKHSLLCSIPFLARPPPPNNTAFCDSTCTVCAGKGWEHFTSAALAALAEQRSGIVFLLWGK